MLVPKMDSDADGFVSEDELRNHINFMQKRYVNNDVERTWKNYNSEKIKDGKLNWKDYRCLIFTSLQLSSETWCTVRQTARDRNCLPNTRR